MKRREEAKCPNCGTIVPLTPEQADYDEVIVTCPKCREQFSHEPESN